MHTNHEDYVIRFRVLSSRSRGIRKSVKSQNIELINIRLVNEKNTYNSFKIDRKKENMMPGLCETSWILFTMGNINYL